MNEPKQYYFEDAIDYICASTNIDEDIVAMVLVAEVDYMRSIGLVNDFEEEQQ